MELKIVKEYEDGSADCEILGMTAVEQEYLIGKGIIALLREHIQREAAEGKLPALLKEKVDAGH